MKKAITILLVLIMCVSVLTACGGEEETPVSVPEPEETTEPAQDESVPEPEPEPEPEPDLIQSPFASFNKVGEVVEFAGFDWWVLDVKDDKAFIVRVNYPTQEQFNSGSPASWETSDIRKFLNGEYFNENFSDEEKLWIIESTIANQGGADTTDRIFLLSIDEVENYLTNEDMRSIFYEGTSSKGMWWLRTPGETNPEGAVMCVMQDGTIDGDRAVNQSIGVRPALWLNIGFIEE